MFEPGDTVGRYSIIRGVGQGPHFDVFQARAFGVEGFERDVALKVVRDPSCSSDTGFRSALKRALSLSHAGVLQLVDSDTIERGGVTRVYFVTELARGERLVDVLAVWLSTASGRAKLLRLASDVARVLDYAARRRTGAVSHGRLHAGQIFVGPRGDAKVADFAVAAAAAGATATSSAAADLSRLADLVEPASSGAEFDAFIASLRSGAVGAQQAAEELLHWSALVREADATSGVERPGDATPAPALELHLERALESEEDDASLASWAPPQPEGRDPAIPPGSTLRPRSLGAGRFVGRHRELAELGVAIDEAASTGARWVHVVGGAGMGSSRLIAELGRRVPADRVTFVRVEGSSAAHSAVGGALRALLDLPSDPSQGTERTVASLRAMGLTTSVISAIFAILGIASVEDEAPCDPATAVLAAVSALQGKRPLVLAFEGDPPIDPSSTRLFRSLIERLPARDVPLLILSPDAVDHDDALSDRDDARSDRESILQLESLSDDELAQLVSSRVGARVLEPELFEAVADLAGGNPLFVEELLRYLAEEALLVVQGGVASLRTPSPDLPSSLRLIADAAARRSSPTARAVVTVLAACANVASPDALAAALAPEYDSAAVGGAIRELTAAGIVREDERGRLHLPRAHVTSEDLALAARGRIGAYFEGAGEFELAARHFEAAGESARAAALWERASDVFAERPDAIDASVGALLHALRASDSPATARARLTRAEERLPRATELPADVEEALAHALSILDAEGGAGTDGASAVASLRLRFAVVLRDRAAFETSLVLLERAAEHTPATALAALRVSIAVAACNPELAPDASEELTRALDASHEHRLDVAEWSYLRGDFERATALVGALQMPLEPRQRARVLRVEVSIAAALRALAPDDPRVDELLALASTLGPDPEAARCFGGIGVHLRRAVKSSHRARSQFVLHEAMQLGEASMERRVASLARAELALATRRQAASKEVLSLAERAHASGDAFSWLSLRASVAELASDELAIASVRRDAEESSLRGVVAHLDEP